MNSLILKTAMPFLVSLILIFSIFVLFRGHNEPGGGFIGGLIAASGIATLMISEGAGAVRRALIIPPVSLAAIGVLLAMSAGLLSLLFGDAFLTGQWYLPKEGIQLKVIATPVLFDIGVFLAVVGGVVAVAQALEERS